MPTHQLRESYASVAELEAPCEEFCEKVNTRAHRAATYSVPRALLGATVGGAPRVTVRRAGVVAHVGDGPDVKGPVEVARHHGGTPGTPRTDDG